MSEFLRFKPELEMVDQKGRLPCRERKSTGGEEAQNQESLQGREDKIRKVLCLPGWGKKYEDP